MIVYCKCLVFSLLIGCVWRPVVAATQLDTFEMNTMCGKYLNLIWKSVFTAKLTFEPFDNSNHTTPLTSCDLDIVSWRHMDRLMVRFTRVDLGENCSQSQLQILDGLSPNSPPIEGLPEVICGTATASLLHTTFASSDRHLRIHYRGNSSITQDVSFSLLLISYHTGRCESYEHSCDNGRCIWGELACNGHNPCGDHSDCNTPPPHVRVEEVADRVTPDNQTLVAAIVSSAVLLILATLAVTIYFRCYRKRKSEHIQRQAPLPGHAVITTTEETDNIDIQLFQSPPSYSSLPPVSATSSPHRSPSASSLSSSPESDTEDVCTVLLSCPRTEEQLESPPEDPCLQETAGRLQSSTETQRDRSDSPPPPSYQCVMSHKEQFHLSTSSVHHPT